MSDIYEAIKETEKRIDEQRNKILDVNLARIGWEVIVNMLLNNDKEKIEQYINMLPEKYKNAIYRVKEWIEKE